MTKIEAGGSTEESVVPLSPVQPIAFHAFHPLGVRSMVTYSNVRDAIDSAVDRWRGRKDSAARAS